MQFVNSLPARSFSYTVLSCFIGHGVQPTEGSKVVRADEEAPLPRLLALPLLLPRLVIRFVPLVAAAWVDGVVVRTGLDFVAVGERLEIAIDTGGVCIGFAANFVCVIGLGVRNVGMVVGSVVGMDVGRMVCMNGTIGVDVTFVVPVGLKGFAVSNPVPC